VVRGSLRYGRVRHGKAKGCGSVRRGKVRHGMAWFGLAKGRGVEWYCMVRYDGAFPGVVRRG